MLKFKMVASPYIFFLFLVLSPTNGRSQKYLPQQDKLFKEINTDVKMQFEKDLILRTTQLEKVHNNNGIAENWSLIPDFGLVSADDRTSAMAVDKNNNTVLLQMEMDFWVVGLYVVNNNTLITQKVFIKTKNRSG